MNRHGILEIDVTRSLPPILKQDPDILAAAQVIGTQLQENIRLSRLNIIYARIDELDEQKLDILAYDLHVDWYDAAMPIQVKRETIKTSVRVHKYLGTRYAVETVVKNWFPDGEVLEWHEYGGRPFYFRVQLNDIIDPLYKKNFLATLEYAKRMTAWLDAIVIIIDVQFYNRNVFVPVRLRIKSRASNYTVTPALFNGEYDFGGGITFDQQIRGRFHLENLRIATAVQLRNGVAARYRGYGSARTRSRLIGSRLILYAAARYPPLCYDGRNEFDGTNLFHGTLGEADGQRRTFFLHDMKIKCGAQNDNSTKTYLLRDALSDFSGKERFDGTRRFQANLTKEEL